jgi:ZIP family zinc transporter
MMAEAALWGLLGASSLLIGAAAGLALPVSRRLVGLVMGFGAGALISAVSFELTAEAFELGGADAVSLGLASGALCYFGANRALASRGGRRRGGRTSPEESSRALLLGAVLDGIPESAVIGITLIGGGEVGAAMVAAVFVSNLPESFAATAEIRDRAPERSRVLAGWVVVVAVCTLASALGYVGLDGASGDAVALIQAFAAGAVLTMLADTMMPEAFEHGGDATGLVTVLGFALAALLSSAG